VETGTQLLAEAPIIFPAAFALVRFSPPLFLHPSPRRLPSSLKFEYDPHSRCSVTCETRGIRALYRYEMSALPRYDLRVSRSSQLSAKTASIRDGGRIISEYGIEFELISAMGKIKNKIDFPSINVARRVATRNFFFGVFFFFSIKAPVPSVPLGLSSRSVARHWVEF